MDYYWEVKPREGRFELSVYYTRVNSNRTHRQHLMNTISCFGFDEIEETKNEFIERNPCEAGGAWRPIDGAVWTWSNGKPVISKDQMKFLTKP